MKTSFCAVLFLVLSLTSLAAAESGSSVGERLAKTEVEKLVGPIALYPDPLVALILPAATRPSDIVLAARHLERGGDPDATDAEPWEESVKALAHYREVIGFLDENLAWTQRLGEAFLAQPDDVMNSIQTLRRRARDAGLLVDTAEHEIVVENGEIRIVPARTTVIHVPRYDPEVLYVERVYYDPFPRRPFLTFGIGYGVGSWLCYEPDWRYPSVRIVHRPTRWYRDPSWRWRDSHRYTPPPGHPPRRWTPPRHHDRPRSHAPRPTHYTQRPRNGDSWPHHAHLNPPRDGERDRPARRHGAPPEPRTGRSQPEPQRRGDSPPTFAIEPVIPAMTPAPMAPSAGERRRGDRGTRFDRSDRSGPPAERPARPVSNPAASAVADSAPSHAAPPPAQRRDSGHTRPDRSERTEPRNRTDDSRGLEREAR